MGLISKPLISWARPKPTNIPNSYATPNVERSPAMDAAAAFLRRALRRGPAHSTAATATATTATATTTTTAGTSSGDRQDDSLLQFGVTEKLLALVRGFTVETFKNCDLSTSGGLVVYCCVSFFF